MHNTNPTTGIRYGVISFNSLQPWCNDDLFNGPTARDLSYEDALLQLKAEAGVEYDKVMERCDKLHGDKMAADVLDLLAQAFFEAEGLEYDHDAFVERYIEEARENIQIDEPIIEGEYDGVKYRISWLGGAPLLWVLEGPIGYVNRLCSPCVPNAADLDSGFITGCGEGSSEDHAKTLEQGFRSYVVPVSWLASES